MFGWLTNLFKGPSDEERLAQITPQLQFARPLDFHEKAYKLVEISVDKVMQYNRETSPHYVVDFDHPKHDSADKFRLGFGYLEQNQGLMYMPAIEPEGLIYHGRHRMAMLEKMGVKVIPALVATTRSVPESFLEQFGVDKPYYTHTPKGAMYHEVRRGQRLGGDAVDLHAPIDRAAIMQTPGAYVPPAPPETPPSEPPGTEHRDRARENNARRTKPGNSEGR